MPIKNPNGTRNLQKSDPSEPPIDRYDLDTNELLLRERPLLPLVNSLSYDALVIFAITGRILGHSVISLMTRAAMDEARRRYRRHSSVRTESKSGDEFIASIAAEILGQSAPSSSLDLQSPWPESMDNDEWAGNVLFHAIPAMAKAILFNEQPNILNAPLTYSSKLMTAFSCQPTVTRPLLEKQSPDLLMSALIGGFGVVAPTTALARFSASTFAPLEWSVVASAMGCGRSHLGACSLAMELLLEANLATSPTRDAVNIYCKKKPFPGFGHPLLMMDPRVSFLFENYKGASIVHKAKLLAAQVTRRYHVQPNIDFAAAVLMLHYGISAVAGAAFFWFCRLPIIIGHICAKRRKPPFGLSSSEAREKYRQVPTTWL